MDSILVTGGAGFIGSRFVRQWLESEPGRVVVLDKLTYAGHLATLGEAGEDPRCEFHRGDVGDRPLVERLLGQHRVGAVVHFAAESHVDRSIAAPADFVITNVVGTYQLLEAARGYWSSLPAERQRQFRFLHVSTDEVYGSLGPEGKFSELSPYAPNSPYSASKAASDHFARAYHRTYGLPVLVTNSSNNFGPCQHPEKLVPQTILCALDGRPIPVYGDGQHVRDWIYVDDHCQALRRVLRQGSPGDSYALGGDCERTNLELVRAICRLVDRLNPHLAHAPSESLIRLVADRPGHDRRYAVDSTKAQRELGWQPRRDFAQCLESTVRWYLDNPQWIAAVSRA